MGIYKSPFQRVREWEVLLAGTQNALEVSQAGPAEESAEIEVKEIFGTSELEMRPANVVVVSDTNGQRWILGVNLSDTGGLKNLLEIKPGKRFKLVVTRTLVIKAQTKVFSL